MRTWVLIAALAAVCLAAEQELSHKEIARRVLKTWDPTKEKKYFSPSIQQRQRSSEIRDDDSFMQLISDSAVSISFLEVWHVRM